jgi:hypothetical protein
MATRGVRLAVLAAFSLAGAVSGARAATYYVRQAAGDDAHDGRSPASAWRHVAKLSGAMQAGDTAYVGPGLYREEIEVRHDGRPDAPITFVADVTGRHTGDPAGAVVLAGSEPVDETVFVPHGPPGVFRAEITAFPVWGVVEMDGPQRRYVHTTITREHLVEKASPVDVVARLRSSWFYDEASRVLYLHTSDDRPPPAHELELIARGCGISVRGKKHVVVIGFTFRHMQDAGVGLYAGSSAGLVQGVVSFGSRQGVRVYGAQDVLVVDSTLFRNENSGVYFAAESTGGSAISNVLYENAKGLRWSSRSVGGRALGNVLFDNLERGLSLEEADGAVIAGNRLIGNAVSQLQVLQSSYLAFDNCFATTSPTQLVADFSPFGFADRFRTLAEYQHARGQDLGSRERNCGPLPRKFDVRAVVLPAGDPRANSRRPPSPPTSGK